MWLRHIAFALLGLPAMAFAGTVACPTLEKAMQVGTCPSEDELRHTFTGFCSDNARIYNWHEESVCTDYALYRRLKNTVLWETRDGDFQGYVSCDLPPEQVRGARPARISVSTKGKLTRVVCSYSGDISFVHRTKVQCKVEGQGDCSADPSTCKASCD